MESEKSMDEQQRQTLSQIYFFQGNAYQELDEVANAIDKYDQAIENNPEYTDAYQGKSNAYQKIDKPALADEFNRKAALLRSGQRGLNQ